MNICVCVKQVEETYARTGRDPQRHFIDPVDRIFRINPYDEAAMMLSVKAAAGIENARIIVLTMGPLLAEDDLWRVMAMGGDQLCQITLTRPVESCSYLDPWSKAQILAEAVTAFDADLVLCGKESLDNQNGLVANFMAHHLNRPFVSAIVDLNLRESATGARITKNTGKGRREIIDCRLPMVFSVDLFSGALSNPSYAAQEKARHQKNITHMVLDSRSLTVRTHPVELAAARPRPKPVMVPDSQLPSFERVCKLLAGSQIQKKGKTISGSPATQVEEIIRFMEVHSLGPAAIRGEHPE